LAAEKAKEMAKLPVKVIKNPYDITEIKIEQETPTKKTNELITPYPAATNPNETESEQEDQEMAPANIAPTSTTPAVAVKAEFFSKQSEDLNAKIEAIKRQIAEQMDSKRNSMLNEALKINEENKVVTKVEEQPPVVEMDEKEPVHESSEEEVMATHQEINEINIEMEEESQRDEEV
jgi:hypothetical protein